MIRPDRSPTRLVPLCAGLAALLLAFCPAQAQPTGDAQKLAAVQEALDLYMEGLIAQDADRIPLASDVIFVEPDGTGETTPEGIGEVAPFLERQTVDSIRVHHTVIDGEWGCELTDYFWTDGPKMPIALCLRVRDGKITEIQPYFDRTLFGD
jgi:hypothetical protein